MTKTIICSTCGSEFADDVKYCPRDGNPLGATAVALGVGPMKCPKCGTGYAGVKFCARDGAKLEAVT